MENMNVLGKTSEKRRNPRFECISSRDFSVDFEGNGGKARLSNLSRDGLSFESTKAVEADRVYQLQIGDFESEKRIPCEVRVVWVRNQDGNQLCFCGAQIVRMDPSDKMDLLDILYEDWKRKVLG